MKRVRRILTPSDKRKRKPFIAPQKATDPCPEPPVKAMVNDKFILRGREVIPLNDEELWAQWFARADRIVDTTQLENITVSTVFLGIDHSMGTGPPLLFETMIFGGPNDGYGRRCSTYDQAERQHAAALIVATDT